VAVQAAAPALEPASAAVLAAVAGGNVYPASLVTNVEGDAPQPAATFMSECGAIRARLRAVFASASPVGMAPARVEAVGE
jgi:hypothetical protein